MFSRILWGILGFYGIFMEKRTGFLKSNLPLMAWLIVGQTEEMGLTQLIWLTTSLKIYSGEESMSGFIWTDQAHSSYRNDNVLQKKHKIFF